MKVEETINQAKALNLESFEAFFNASYPSIKNFLYYKTGDVALAEDIAQDAFLKFWEVRDTVKMETAKSFLYRIASNLAVNQLKRQNVLMRFINQQLNNGSAESPDYLMELKEFDEKLQKAISDLPEKSRVVFLMNRIDGLTYREIAELLEISVKAVEKRMHKALEELKKTIKHKI